MNYELINMGAYNLHLIKTSRFKTITVEVDFRREIQREDITKRAILKEVLLNSNKSFKTERELILESENLYDLKLVASSARMGNYTNISFKTRFLEFIIMNIATAMITTTPTNPPIKTFLFLILSII